MSYTITELVSAMQTALNQLNHIMLGSDVEVVTINAVTKPTISKAINDAVVAGFSAIQAATSGRKAYQTKANMDADLAPAANTLAEVWGDSTAANNGVYAKLGASGAGSWTKSLYDPVTALKNDIYAAALKYSSGVLTNGGAFNGAVFFDGTTSVGATDATGGWKIPAGQTGRGTYNRYRWTFTADKSAKLAGRKVRFVVMLKSSANLLTTLMSFGHGTASVGGSGTFENKTYYQEASDRVVIQFDYRFVGTETEVNSYLQVNGSQTVLAADAWLAATSQHWSAIDAAGSKEVLDMYLASMQAAIDTLKASMAYNYLSSGNLREVLVPSSQVFNGASYTVTQTAMGALIPALSTGQNSYMAYHMPIGEISENLPGATVRMRLEFRTSANFKSKYGGLSVNVNGNKGTNQGVAGSFVTEQVDSDTLVVTGDYVLKGFRDELMGPYIQLGTALDTSAERYFYLESATYWVVNSGQLGKTGVDAMLEQKLRAFEVSSGDLKQVAGSEGEQFNGGEVYDGGWGIRVPAGASGLTTYRRYRFDADLLKKYVGTKLRLEMTLTTSADFTNETNLAGNLSVWYDNAGPSYSAAPLYLTKLSSTKIVAVGYLTIAGHETDLGPYIKNTTPGVRTTDGTWTLADMRFTFVQSGDEDESVLEQMSDYRTRVAASVATPSEVSYVQTVVVKPDGTGNYTTLKDACAMAAGVSALQRALIKVYPGVYADTNYYIPNFCDVVGIGERDQVWLKGELPDNVAVATIPTVQTIWMNQTSRLRNLKITARNMRYPIHSDSGASGYRALQEIEDCYVEHLGNQGAKDYQTSIGGNPNGVWGSEHAWGCGTHSGQRIYSRGTHWVSRTSPFYFHTNRDFAEPCYVEVDRSHVICTTDTGNALVVQALGSGQPDRFVVKDSVVRGPMNINDQPWLSLLPENQRANRMEVEVTISGCGPVAWDSSQQAATLELRSIAGASSAVAVGGTGAEALFGKQPDVRPGSDGYAGRVYGIWSIADGSSYFETSMGKRLGDCTATAKTLNITFDGSINRSIVLNQNYTAMDNNTVLGLLNAALADGAGRAFFISDPWENRAKVYQPDYDRVAKNTGTTAILKGMAVAMNGSQHNVRVMTSADAATLFYGVAMEDMPVGQFGRVQKGGQVFSSHLLFDGTPSIGFGDTLVVSASQPGRFIEAAGTPLLRCVEVRGSRIAMEVLA